MLRKGVNDEGKRPPEGGKKRPSTAAGRSVDAQEKDGVGTDEQDEVEAHRDTGRRAEALGRFRRQKAGKKDALRWRC